MSLALTRDGDRLPVRVWSVVARTGAVLGEVLPLSGSTWSMELGGGECDLTVDLNLRLRDDSGWDWTAISYMRDLVDPYRRSVIVTQGTVCLGEWLLTTLEPQGATQVALHGAALEQYPSSRAVRQRYKWPLSKDQMQAAKDLLADAFAGSAPTLTVPTPSNSGVTVEKDDRLDAWSTDYGQALDSLCDTDNGLEWQIVPSVAWSGGQPTTVTRTVVWGFPEIQRATSLVARRPQAGERGGNVTSWGRPLDMSRLVTKAVVLGRGSGKKQVKGSYTDESLLAAGYLPAEKVWTEPTIKKAGTATRRAKRRVSAAAASLRMPGPAVLLLADSESWPQPGDMVGLDIAATPADPVAATGTLRAGKVSWTITAGAVDQVTVEGVEQ